MKYQLTLFLLALQAATAAMVSFEGSVTGTITVLSAGPVVENSASGVAQLIPFGVGEYVKHGFMDFTDLNPNGSGTGTGTFRITFAGDDSFSGTYVETAFPPTEDGGVVFSHEYTITAGTGMFAGASGHASHSPVTTYLTDPQFTLSMTGVISGPLLQPVPEPHTAVPMLAALALIARAAGKQRRRKFANAHS